MKKGENLFIVDLVSVSLLSKSDISVIMENEQFYKKTPFLFILFSYIRNASLSWANKNLQYIDKKQKGSWAIYKFQF